MYLTPSSQMEQVLTCRCQSYYSLLLKTALAHNFEERLVRYHVLSSSPFLEIADSALKIRRLLLVVSNLVELTFGPIYVFCSSRYQTANGDHIPVARSISYFLIDQLP